jgi:mRNA interferase MazF
MMSSLPKPSRGEVWELEWDNPRGSEEGGNRPSVIVQNDGGNHSDRYTNTIIVAISRSGRDVPFHVPIKATRTNGLRVDGFVKCEHLLTASKERLVGKRARGRLSEEDLALVDAALRKSLAL